MKEITPFNFRTRKNRYDVSTTDSRKVRARDLRKVGSKLAIKNVVLSETKLRTRQRTGVYRPCVHERTCALNVLQTDISRSRFDLIGLNGGAFYGGDFGQCHCGPATHPSISSNSFISRWICASSLAMSTSISLGGR